jgi:Dirigent-like protein
MRRAVVLSACLVVGGLMVPSSALATEDDDGDRWIAAEDEVAFVLPDGTTFTEDSPPMEGEEESAPVGTRLFITELLYDTDDGSTRGDEVGRTHIECTAQVVADNFLCVAAFVFDDDEDSQLHGTVDVDFASMDPAETVQFDVAVTGGTGAYRGASGVVTLTDVTDSDDPQAEVLTLYEADLD